MTTENNKPEFVSEVLVDKNLTPKLQNRIFSKLYGDCVRIFISRKFRQKDPCLDFFVQTDLINENEKFFTIQINFYNNH